MGKKLEVLSDAHLWSPATELTDTASAGTVSHRVGPSADDIRHEMAVIDSQIIEHVEWLDRLNETLICRVPFNADDLRLDAHQCCPFGRWYEEEAPDWLRDVEGFDGLGDSHRKMHEIGAHLLKQAMEGRQIAKEQYDVLLAQLREMRQGILMLKRRLENRLFDFDPLTGAGNRVGMLSQLHRQQELVNRHLVDCMLVMMDIDYFKRVNDTFGHAAGDRALVAFAQYVMNATRPFDMLFRYGGEEFLLCAPQASGAMALQTVERLREGVAEVKIARDGAAPDGEAFNITASFGIAFMAHGVSTTEAIRRADVAAYAAKQAGRNCTKIWSPDMDEAFYA